MLSLRVGLGIGPRPRRRHHRVEGDVADLVVLDLVDVAVDHVHLVEGREDRLHVLGVVRPEVPALVELLERGVGEDDDRCRLRHLGEVRLQPLALLLADHEGRALRVVEARHLEHPLLARGPPVVPRVVGEDAVQHDEVHALVVPAVPLWPEELRPVLPEVQVVVVLPHHEVGLAAELREHLGPVVELLLHRELAEVAPEDDEVRLRRQHVRLGHRADEAAVPVADELRRRAGDELDVGVGDVGEREVLGRVGESQLHDAHGDDAGRGRGGRAPEEVAAARDEGGHRFTSARAPLGSDAYSGLVRASMKATRSSISGSVRPSGRMPELRKSLTGSPSFVTPPLL